MQGGEDSKWVTMSLCKLLKLSACPTAAHTTGTPHEMREMDAKVRKAWLNKTHTHTDKKPCTRWGAISSVDSGMAGVLMGFS